MRNHIIDFLVTRSKNFAEEMKDTTYDRRAVPVVRPGAPEPSRDLRTDRRTRQPGPDAGGRTERRTPSWPGLIQGRA